MQTSLVNKKGTYDKLPILETGRVHELSGSSAAAFAMLATGEQRVVLCGPPHWVCAFHPQGVISVADPYRFIHVPCPLKADALWTAETALRSGAVEMVVLGVEQTPDLTAFRRLQLAAETGKTLGILCVNRPAHTSAAETRWHCTPYYEPEKTEESKPDSTLIHLSLYKNKKGTLGQWIVDVAYDGLGDPDTRFVAAAPADRPAGPDRVAGA